MPLIVTETVAPVNVYPLFAVMVSVCVLPSLIDATELEEPQFNRFRVIEYVVTVCDMFTVTSQEADTFPAVAVITQEPLETGVTTPFSTVATSVLLEAHTIVSVELDGVSVAVIVCVAEPVKLNVVLFKLIPVAGIWLNPAIYVSVHV